MKLLSSFLHLLFGGVFVYAGWRKLQDPGAFLLDVHSFDLLPDPYGACLALFLPWLELLAGLAVVSGWGRRGGLLLLNASLLVFLAALGLSWVRGLDIRCGCFGGSADAAASYAELILRDQALLAVGLCLQFWRRLSAPASPSAPAAPGLRPPA